MLRAQNLSRFPLEVWDLYNLRRLSIENNGISVIPPDIENVQQLEDLVLRENQIVLLPSQIGTLYKLQRLDASFNLITSLPPELQGCTSLKELYLDSCRLSTFDLVITKLPVIEKISLNSNSIHELPHSLIGLTRLAVLNMLHNALKEVNPNLYVMTSLTECSMIGNLVTSPPAVCLFQLLSFTSNIFTMLSPVRKWICQISCCNLFLLQFTIMGT